MLEIVLEAECERLATIDPLGMSGTIPRDKALQYSSLIGEYAECALHEDTPQFDHHSIASDDVSASEIYLSKELKSASLTDGKREILTLKYTKNKAPLVKRIQRLYDIFARLAAGNYAPADIPKGARLADVFTSHHSQMFLFETETPKAAYIRFTKDAEKFKNFKNVESVAYQLTG